MHETTTLTEMILPEQRPVVVRLVGGGGLSLMTRAAFVAASRHAREKIVLAACHDARFVAPVPIGSLFVLTATVVSVGRSSMRVRVDGVCERPEAGTQTHVAQATFTMVAVDAAGHPVAVPPLEADAA